MARGRPLQPFGQRRAPTITTDSPHHLQVVYPPQVISRNDSIFRKSYRREDSVSMIPCPTADFGKVPYFNGPVAGQNREVTIGAYDHIPEVAATYPDPPQNLARPHIPDVARGPAVAGTDPHRGITDTESASNVDRDNPT